jgi:glucosamine--fructose-6-phosphate aminotransferase (isomerizing)
MSRGEITKSLDGVNRAMEQVLLSSMDRAVDLCSDAASIFFVGRGAFYAVALEGALKMKEISYIHAEGYAAGEIKHGPFALLSPKTPAVGLCLPGEIYSVMVSNLREMKARGVPLIVIGQEGDLDLEELADVFIPLPEGDTVQNIFAATVALQLLAYNTAVRLGREIDTPRNLAKSVTVE